MDRKKVRTIFISVMIATAMLVGPRVPAALAAVTSSSQVFSGTVVTASGEPVLGAKVTIALAPRGTGRFTPIGTVLTAINGRWSIPAPAYASLPKAAQVAAAANDGYLNVTIVTMRGSAISTATESAWVGSPAQVTETSSNRPVPMVMRLGSAVAVKKGCCSPRFGCSFPFVAAILGKSHAYTVVGEWHADWDASGGVDYTRGADSSIGSYLSASGANWGFTGYDNYNESTQATMSSLDNGPFNSHRLVVSLNYIKRLWEITDNASNVVCSHYQTIDENGVYNPGHNWVVFKEGANVLAEDGNAKYVAEERAHPGYINVMARHTGFTLNKGKGVTYGAGADVFGVGIQEETTNSSDASQEYTAGLLKTRPHFVWGNNGTYTSNPNVVYSY